MNLKEIKYSTILFSLSKKEMDKMIFIEDKYDAQVVYDIAILFGGISMLPNRADKALQLYKEKRIKKIIVSGGIGFLSLKRHTTEASKLSTYLLSKGVKKEDILIEDKSRNTRENIEYSIKLINDYDLKKINILLITSDFHLQRCLRLMHHFINSQNIYGIGITDDKNDLIHWHNHLSSKKNIYVEALLLAYYAKKDKLYLGEINNE